MTNRERRAKIEYLSAYRWILIDIESEEENLERLTDRMYSPKIPALTGMPRGGRAVTIDDNVATKINLECQVSENRLRAEIEKQRIEDAIASLPDARDRTILKLKFIQGRTHEQIAEVIRYSVTQERKFYSAALDHFQIPDTL